MARGWESKGIEAQQEAAAGETKPGKPRLTGEEAARLRERESLLMSLRRVTQELERSSNPSHRAMLQSARGDLEQRIKELDPLAVEPSDQS